MKNHNEMVNAVFQKRDEYEAKKSRLIKKTMSAIVACILISIMTVSVYAISSIIKEMNIFQKAHEDGISISEVDTEGNFIHEDLSNLDTTIEDESIDGVSGEKFEDSKADIFNKMLNTIDNFDYLCLEMETSMLNSEKTVVEFQINIVKGISYESVTENGYVSSETYSSDGNMIYVDNIGKTYIERYLPTYTRSDTPYIKLKERITTGEDGIPCYHYRRNITNCPLASYSIVPQELTFSYLKDFGKWNITDDNFEYLGRNCTVIKGKTASYIEEKQGSDEFTMVVDSETGILLKLEGTKSGNVVYYTTVTSCNFEKTISVKVFDFNQYFGYKEKVR